MQVAITFRTKQFLGDRSVDVEFPISITTKDDIHESLFSLVNRIKSDYLPIIRDEVENREGEPDYKLTDEIVIKIVK